MYYRLTLLSKHEGLPFSRWSAKDIEVDELTDWLVEVNDQMIDRLVSSSPAFLVNFVT